MDHSDKVSAKDILRGLATKRISEDDSVTDIVRDAYFVPETKLVSELFEELRKTGHQIAICLDEYGGIAGLVTIKRLTEVVVGRVGEEGQSPEEEYASIRPNVYRIEGGMGIEEVNDQMNLGLPEGDYETIAGFVLAQLGEIPTVGNQFEYGTLLFRVEEMDHFRIDSVMIRKRIAPSSEGDNVKNRNNMNGEPVVDDTHTNQTRGD